MASEYPVGRRGLFDTLASSETLVLSAGMRLLHLGCVSDGDARSPLTYAPKLFVCFLSLWVMALEDQRDSFRSGCLRADVGQLQLPPPGLDVPAPLTLNLAFCLLASALLAFSARQDVTRSSIRTVM